MLQGDEQPVCQFAALRRKQRAVNHVINKNIAALQLARPQGLVGKAEMCTVVNVFDQCCDQRRNNEN
jgi:hypothetical protein